MSVSDGLKTTLGIIDAAGSLFYDPNNPQDAQDLRTLNRFGGKVNKALGVVNRYETAGSAITSLSAQTTILSRVFLDEGILNEPILPNLMRSIHSWYTAQIIAGLHLTQMVGDGKTVQDVMSVVQTGHNARHRDVVGNVVARRMGQESFLENYLGEAALESTDPRRDPKIPFAHIPREDYDRLKKGASAKDATSESNTLSVRSVNTSENRIGPMGELYELKLSNPNGTGQSVTVPVFIQMQPSIIPEDTAPRFIDMNVEPSLWQRWTQMRAGELTFWKDFLLHHDLIKRQKSIIKDPAKAKAFSDFLKTVAKKDKYALDDVTDRIGSRQSANLANSVIIFSEDTVTQAKNDSGVDLHNTSDRIRYFRDTYTMILVIVDPLHQRVTVYFNGLDGDINASYNDFHPKDSKFDPKELVTALQAFSSNSINRLR